MKNPLRIAHLAGAFALASALACATDQASAQSSAPASAAAPVSAPAPVSARAQRAANRKLAHRVESALGRTRGLNPARLIVTARDGHITLSGSVTYGEQIPLAVNAAGKVDGVIDVDNRIRVSGASL